jgi:hypothetical protein
MELLPQYSARTTGVDSYTIEFRFIADSAEFALPVTSKLAIGPK